MAPQIDHNHEETLDHSLNATLVLVVIEKNRRETGIV